MLVLSRKVDTRIVITDLRTRERIVITTVDIRGDKVRLGLDAGQDYAIHREEVQREIDRETQETEAQDASKPAA